MNARSLILTAMGSLALAGCMTAPSPVEVTRFHQVDQLSQLGQGTVFIESAADTQQSGLELAPYKAAVATQLVQVGYTETDRANAQQIVQVDVSRFALERAPRSSPVSVGVGGSAGSYGSGAGVGIGINLGGGDREKLGAEMRVSIRAKDATTNLWEGRANFTVDAASELSDPAANASALADAMFREFPGNNGETIEVKVNK